MEGGKCGGRPELQLPEQLGQKNQHSSLEVTLAHILLLEHGFHSRLVN